MAFSRKNQQSNKLMNQRIKITEALHSPMRRFDTSDQVSGKRAWRGAPCAIKQNTSAEKSE